MLHHGPIHQDHEKRNPWRQHVHRATRPCSYAIDKVWEAVTSRCLGNGRYDASIVSRQKHNMLSLLHAACLKLLVFSVVTLTFPFARPFPFFPPHSYGNFTPQHPDWLLCSLTKHSPPAPPHVRKHMHMFSALFLDCFTLEDGTGRPSRNVGDQLPTHAP